MKSSSKAQIVRLEDFLLHLDTLPPLKGRAFVKLCASLVEAMGFSNIKIRRGTEQGRDIEGQFGDTKWYFECKCSSGILDTPKVAYKFLQLDILSERLRPHFFVLMSNAPTTSILDDIIAFRNSERRVKYSILSWTNDPENNLFDRILLSYPAPFVDFIREYSYLTVLETDKLIDDFKNRSEEYLRTNQPFFEQFKSSIAVLKERQRKHVPSPTLDFILNNAENFIIREEKLGIGFALVLIGAPIEPVSGMFDFNDFKTIQSFKSMLRPWGVSILGGDSEHLLCGEGSNRTIFFDWGGIATVSELSLYPDVMKPWEWLRCLREDCLRMRNFCKRGMLRTPAVFRASITVLNPFRRDLLEGKTWLLGSIDYYVADSSERNCIIGIPGIRSDIVRFDNPFDMNHDLGRPLASSIWINAGMSAPLLVEAKEVEKELLRRKLSESLGLIVRFAESFEWLLGGELPYRSYSVFEKMVKEEII